MLAAAESKVFQFENFTLDIARGSLRADGSEVVLRPKSFEVLRYLVENPDRLLSKDEIMKAVWPNVFVTDDSLKRCISEVRDALGDTARRIVKTVPRRGYLFSVPVSCIGAASRGPAPLLPDKPSIAVLPFLNMSGYAEQDYFSDGISEDITTSLSKFADLLVIARNSAFQYKGRNVDAKRIGQELGVRYLLEGSVRRDAERVRITAQLIEADTGKHVWAEHYDGDLAGIFALQDEVTRKIVVTLVAHVNNSEIDRALRKSPETLAAYDCLLRGNAAVKVRYDGPVASARELYKQAIAIDPRYARAIVGLADTYFAAWVQPMNGPLASEFGQSAILDRALTLAQEATELDGNLAQAHAMLGWILHWHYRRIESMLEFERAFELNPNLSERVYRYGIALIHNGRTEAGIDFLRRTMRLDPFYPADCESCLGTGLYLLGRYPEALACLRTATRRISGIKMFLTWHAAAAAQIGEREEARAAVANALRLEPDLTIAKLLSFIRFAKDEDAQHIADGLRKAGLPE